MSHYIEAIEAAHKECTEWICLNPDYELRPIGAIFSEIHEPSLTSTEFWPKKYTYKVVAHCQIFRHRRGATAYYDKHEEIKCIKCIEIKEQK